jgi:uncharacterized membrane protein YbhN (UPF0104 family)
MAQSNTPYKCIFSLGLGATLLYFVIQHVSWEGLVSTLSTASWPLLFVSLLLALLSTLCRAARFAVLLGGTHRMGKLYAAFATLRFLKFALPFHSGELAFLGLLKGYGIVPTIAEILPLWVLLRATDVVVLGSFAGVCLLFVHPSTPLAQWLPYLALVVGAAFLIGAVPVVLLKIRHGKRQGGTQSWLSGRLGDVKKGLVYVKDRKALGMHIFYSICLWAAMTAMAVVALKAFHAPLGIFRSSVSAVIATLISFLPIHPPLGIGTHDAAWTGAISFVGVGLSCSVALALALRLTFILFVLLHSPAGMIPSGREANGG